MLELGIIVRDELSKGKKVMTQLETIAINMVVKPQLVSCVEQANQSFKSLIAKFGRDALVQTTDEATVATFEAALAGIVKSVTPVKPPAK